MRTAIARKPQVIESKAEKEEEMDTGLDRFFFATAKVWIIAGIVGFFVTIASAAAFLLSFLILEWQEARVLMGLIALGGLSAYSSLYFLLRWLTADEPKADS